MPRLRRRRKDHWHLTLADVLTLDGADLSWGYPTLADVQAFYDSRRADFLGPPRHNEQGERLGTPAGNRPWCWWLWDSKQPRDVELEEAEQLFRMGELAQWEIAALVQSPLASYVRWPFRRSWLWWEFLAPERREARTPEAAQLVSIEELTAQEQAIVEDPRKAMSNGFRGGRTRFYYLSQAERDLLGIPHGDLETELRKRPTIQFDYVN